MTALDDWLIEVGSALALGDVLGERDLVLDVTRDVAHGVMRPAAPLTSYLMGIAVGRGVDPEAAAATITALAERWAETHES